MSSAPQPPPERPSLGRPAANFPVTLVILVSIALLILDRLGIGALRPVLAVGYQWLILLAGVALLIGALNVAVMHLWRIQTGQRDWVLSLVLVAVLLAVFVAGVLSPAGANGPAMDWAFHALVAPGQASLFALLAFFMAAAAYRYLRIERPGGAWMLAGALIMLLAQWPLLAQWLPPAFVTATFWLLDGPVMAALRGLLLGSGIALLVAGLRLLVGKA